MNAGFTVFTVRSWGVSCCGWQNPLNYHPNLALSLVCFFKEQYEKAVHYVTLITQAKPHFSVPYALLVTGQVHLDRFDLAQVAAKRHLEIAPGFTISGFVRADYWGPQLMEMLAVALRKAGLPE